LTTGKIKLLDKESDNEGREIIHEEKSSGVYHQAIRTLCSSCVLGFYKLRQCM